VSTIGDWLASIGMSEYAELFVEHRIDLNILPELTDQDLEKLGVVLGDRRRMLRAIRGLDARPVAVGPAPPPSPSEPKPQDNAERRQVTVMFADLVDSTALAVRMDPEDLRELIAAYRRRIVETVRRFDGFVANYMGDGALVYFGYPAAHEDDAERAVRAGLDLIAAIDGLDTREPLRTRIGIATGLVVVGDIVGSGGALECGIVGETPNLAARLQAIAEPNMVVIAEGTRKLLGNLFELQDFGARELKGIAGQVRAWAALRASCVESRFEALRASGLTALVGREEESELLLRRWAKVKKGEGQVVLLAGEAGIGKSRLTAELLERLAGEPHIRLRYFCSPLHTDSAFYPIIDHMERAAEVTHGDSQQTKLEKLGQLLAQTSTSSQDVSLFVEMLSLPNDGRYPMLDLVPQERRQRTLEALCLRMERLTRCDPVLMIFEDAHWVDPTSLEVLGRMINQIARLRALLIVTFRPEFEAPWIGRPHVTVLTINRLTQRDAASLIDRLVDNKPLPASIRQDIIKRTDGIPLFVEEMTKAVLEAGSEQAARRPAEAMTSPALAVPASLHASLMARLDRLGQAKEVAQIGAAIDREFSHALLAAVARKPELELQSALERLIAAGLLFRQGVAPHSTYLFKHALVQEAAYGTLLRDSRRALHASIAETLESQFAELAETQPELLAKHSTKAGLIERAVRQWGKAGQRSLTRSALVEAAEQLARALAQIATLPGTPALRREELKLQVALANALMPTKGFAAPETKAALERARLLVDRAEALGEPAEDPLLVYSVLYGFWAANFAAFNGEVMRELARSFLVLAEKQSSKIPLAIGHRLMGHSMLFTGDIAEGRAHYDQALALYDPAEHRPLATRFGQDTSVSVLSYRSTVLWILGYPAKALADTAHVLEHAREIGHAGTLMYALFIASFTPIHCGSYGTAVALLDELIALTDERSAAFWKAAGMARQGIISALTGNASHAVQMITSGMEASRATGTTLYLPVNLSYLARAYAELGKHDDARRSIGEAISASETAREKWYDAEIYRKAGEIALMAPRPDAGKAQAYFERALAVARAQRAKSWELRAAMSTARLWRDGGKQSMARDLLASVYGWFNEGFDTLDLIEAKALLGELSQ
jgi:class 3 adenylate cyclase/predicted ATPase